MDLALRWRFDLVFGTLAVLAAALYLAGVRRLRRAGRPWPAGRTAAWLAGCAVLLVATSSGIGTYGPAVFSVHMVQHMLIATFVPVLLVLGHGMTMALELSPDRMARRLVSLLDAPAMRLARNPAIAWAAVAVTLFGLYPTGLFDTIVAQHWAHLAMDTVFFLTGLALFWPRARPERARGRAAGDRSNRHGVRRDGAARRVLQLATQPGDARGDRLLRRAAAAFRPRPARRPAARSGCGLDARRGAGAGRRACARAALDPSRPLTTRASGLAHAGRRAKRSGTVTA